MSTYSNYAHYKSLLDELLLIPNSIKKNPSYFRALSDNILKTINYEQDIKEKESLQKLYDEIINLLEEDGNNSFLGSTTNNKF